MAKPLILLVFLHFLSATEYRLCCTTETLFREKRYKNIRQKIRILSEENREDENKIFQNVKTTQFILVTIKKLVLIVADNVKNKTANKEKPFAKTAKGKNNLSL